MQELALLVTKAQNGDKEAFKGIFERLNNRLFAYVLLRTSNREDALDIVQETFIELWNALSKFKYRTEEEFNGFVFTLAKRKLYKHYKTKEKSVQLNEGANGSYEMKTEDYRYLLKNINTLSSEHQELLKLRYWSGMTFREIASVLNVKETTAKVRHHRAIQQLKILLENYDNAI